jgi:peroxiredoxin Q/BCP
MTHLLTWSAELATHGHHLKATMKSIEVGDPAPELTATTSDGQRFLLADYQGKQIVVIFFYPKDNSHICTQEACSFRDAYDDFVKLGAVVVGISSDSDESHRSFAAAQNLPYLLIADHDGALRQLFGVPKSMLLLPGRVTYVIDLEGIVRLKFNSQLFGAQHVQEALQMVRKLTNSDRT